MSTRKGWLIAGGSLLAVSLALNMVALGVFAGRHITGEPPHHGPPFMRGVPEQARPALRAAFREHRDDFRSRLRDIRAARGRVAELLAAPELDEAALRGAFGDLSARTQAMQSLMHDVILEAARELPPEARARWRREWAERGPPHGKPSRRGFR